MSITPDKDFSTSALWHVGLGHPFLWVAVLCIVGELTASIPSWKMLEHDNQSKMLPNNTECSLGDRITPCCNHCHTMFLSGPFQSTPVPPRGNCSQHFSSLSYTFACVCVCVCENIYAHKCRMFTCCSATCSVLLICLRNLHMQCI